MPGTNQPASLDHSFGQRASAVGTFIVQGTNYPVDVGNTEHPRAGGEFPGLSGTRQLCSRTNPDQCTHSFSICSRWLARRGTSSRTLAGQSLRLQNRPLPVPLLQEKCSMSICGEPCYRPARSDFAEFCRSYAEHTLGGLILPMLRSKGMASIPPPKQPQVPATPVSPIKDLWCPTCARPVQDPLVCGDCSAVLCRVCGTPLESADELAFG